MNDQLADLRARFGIPGVATIEQSPSGLARIGITSRLCDAELYLHGAHVTQFRPAGHGPVLFLSRRSKFARDAAIRGGVPICFPWFGPHPHVNRAPAHGIARLAEWALESLVHQPDGAVAASLALKSDEQSKQFFPHDFDLRFTVTFGTALEMTLEVCNPSPQSYRFEEALHTYLAVGDVRQITIAGLEHTDYLDKVQGGRRARQDSAPVQFSGEVDRVYVDTPGACVLHDPAERRRVVIGKTGSLSTVVWNPWIARARALEDMEPDGWQHMVCIESANAGPNAVELAPGATRAMSASVRVEAL